MAVSPGLSRHAALITSNREDYSDIYPNLTFPDAVQAATASRQRQQILADIATSGSSTCGDSKIYSGALSPGCRLCSEGAWSCLFINGRCNRSCVYCPTSQDDIGLPTTNNVTFRSPADYVSYLEHFDFRGMSLSGGEPTLTPGRCLAFLRAAKRKLGQRLHSWMYTNGSLITKDLLLTLRDAGLDEIRFDIGALDYSLEKAKMAVNIIPTVTVEIPALPEQIDLLKGKLHEMADCGINHLNLHQLRLTSYNHRRLKGRPYTYLHGEKITVLESELTALELLRYGINEKIDLPVNYCSFVYKHRYQRAAARGRGAQFFSQGWEAKTRAGYLRNLQVQDTPEQIRTIVARLEDAGLSRDKWSSARTGESLTFAAEAAPYIGSDTMKLEVSYTETPVKEHLSYRYPFRDIKLPSGRKICSERLTAKCLLLDADEAALYLQWLSAPLDTILPPDNEKLMALTNYEQLPEGLQDYF